MVTDLVVDIRGVLVFKVVGSPGVVAADVVFIVVNGVFVSVVVLAVVLITVVVGVGVSFLVVVGEIFVVVGIGNAVVVGFLGVVVCCGVIVDVSAVVTTGVSAVVVAVVVSTVGTHAVRSGKCSRKSGLSLYIVQSSSGVQHASSYDLKVVSWNSLISFSQSENRTKAKNAKFLY